MDRSGLLRLPPRRATALKWEEVDLAAGTLSVRRSLVGARRQRPTPHEPRTVRSRCLMALLRQRARQAEDRLAAGGHHAEHGLMLTTYPVTPLLGRDVLRSFQTALERARRPRSVRIHDLRHAAATLMLAAGVHPKVASERLGPSTVTTTLDLYTHAVQGMDADAAQRMQAAMRAVRPLAVSR